MKYYINYNFSKFLIKINKKQVVVIFIGKHSNDVICVAPYNQFLFKSIKDFKFLKPFAYKKNDLKLQGDSTVN